MELSLWQFALILIAAVCVDTGSGQAPAQHSQHAHSNFGNVRSKPSNTRFKRPVKPKLNTEYIDNVVKIFKQHVQRLRSNKKLDLIFVIDASYSVQLPNFKDEIRFVSRFVSGIPVSMDTTRVAVITFADSAKVWVDQVTADNIHEHKCSLLGTELPAITYASGSTYTLGGLTKAMSIASRARPDSKKVVLLITDGRSNGGDPRGVAQRIRRRGVEILTFGVQSGNVEELTNIASEPKEDHVYILSSFAEFEAVARRALYADAVAGDYITEDASFCHKYCDSGENCCHSMGACRCGTTTGTYECVCNEGFFGLGRIHDGCMPCPSGTYKSQPIPGGSETCTRCPDPNMLSVNGSTSLDQCTCRKGYARVKNRCEVVRCPELSAPSNGRFEGLLCSNRYKSRCRIYCDEGYDLAGSQAVMCDIGGVWLTLDGQSVEDPTCQIRHCPPLVAPDHAIANCSTPDNVYKSVCQFQCEESYAYVGSVSRYCQANTNWDGQDGVCQEIRCRPPQPPLGGSISANCQVSGSQTLPYGHTCQLSCPTGFALSTLSEAVCFQLDRWTVDTSSAKCVDIEPPQIQCPPDVEAVGNAQLGNAEVTWTRPVPIDNSGQVTLTAIPALTPPTTLYIGIFPLTYQAIDASGLHSECNMTITVLDNQPPIIGRCENPAPFLVSPGQSVARNVRWTEPTFSDNSGSVFVNQSQNFGDLPYGQTEVTYVASDAAGNSRQCVIMLSVQNNLCPPLEDPKYGYKSCQMGLGNMEECELLCNSDRYGMAMQEYGTPFYTCQDNGVWEPVDNIPKDCSHQRYSSEIIKGFRSRYSMTFKKSCNDTQLLESVRLDFVAWLTPVIPRWCKRANINLVCTLVSVEVICIQEILPEPAGTESTSFVYGGGPYYWEEERARKKRDVESTISRQRRSGDDYEPAPPDAGSDYDYSYGQDPAENGAELPPVPNVAEEQQDLLSLTDKQVLDIVPEDGKMIHRIEVTVTIRGEVELTNDENTVESRQVHGQMSEFFGQLDISRAFKGRTPIPIRHINTSETEYINYEEDAYSQTPESLQCSLGAVLRGSATCVNCPIGTFFDVTSGECVSCSVGFYQDAEAQLSCKACPDDKSTDSIHSRTLEECKPICRPGTYSSNGIEVCLACPLNTYSDDYGTKECTTCPPDTNTTIEGATSYLQCGPLCEAGYASWTGIGPCYACPRNTYQYRTGQKFCYECPAGTYTSSKGSTSYNQCIGTTEIIPGQLTEEEVLGMHFVTSTLAFSSCFLDLCQNNGTCEPSGAGYTCICQPGFTGGDCQIEIDECASDPCFNDGSCTDRVNKFVCTCAPGYEGTQCQTETNECFDEPCMNGAECIDKLADFDCDCAAGYTGRLCETDIDDCESSPCLNDGTCADLVDGFSCACAPGYAGYRCRENVDECSSEPCLNGGTCADLVNAFTCSCPAGFEGVLCEININDCVNVQCHNGGSCLDLVNDYRCVCAPTFTGPSCDTELDPDFDLSFFKPNAYQHVHMQDGIGNITEITVAFYIFSNQTEGEGTPISYATESVTDAFVLTNLAALTLYVNGEAVVTDSRKLNDGTWYHVVVTWKSVDGSWVIYVDQAVEASGTGLQTGNSIPGGGAFVLGQEQDCLDGCFSSSQEFIGKLSQLNIYNYAMTSRQVAGLFLNCVRNKGNIKAWPDTLGGLIGQVEVLRPATFCQSCEPIPPVNHLSVTVENRIKSVVRCQPGFNLGAKMGTRNVLQRNPMTLRCGNSGMWRFRGNDVVDPVALMFCQRKKCPTFVEIPFARTKATGSVFNDTVTYTCNEGYQRTGVGKITCQANQKWSAPPPTCSDINECNRNPCHLSASCTNSEGSFHCQCDVGYSGDGFLCNLIDCGEPAQVQHGIITGDGFNLNDVVRFSCAVGYELIGETELTCQETGQWSGENPVCNIIRCVSPPTTDHSSVSATSETYLGEATYVCDPGYELLGQPTRVCLETTFWSGSTPACLPVECPYPPLVTNAAFSPTLDLYHFEDVVTYECDRGYELVDNDVLRCGEDKTWQGTLPECLPKSCGSPPNIANGQFEGTVFTFDNTVQYMCDVGYNLNGTELLLCLDTASWSSEAPQCDPVPCGPIATITNGHVEETGTVFLDEATFFCDIGYYMVGPSKLTCLSHGFWGDLTTGVAAIPPTCLPEPCGPPEDVDNAFYELFGADDFVYKSHVEFSCLEGYFPTGRNTLFCMSDRSWNKTGEAFQCNPVPCPQPEPLKNGKIDGQQTPAGSYTFQQSISYTCDAGFNLIGSNTSTCQSTRTWSATPPLCDPVHCGELPDVSNAVATLQHGPHKPGPHFQSQTQYNCHTGFQLSAGSTDTRICGSNAKWTGTAPVCERVPCGAPPSVDHGLATPSNPMVFGDATVYTCDLGFEVKGSASVNCTSSGNFSAIPSCDPVPCGTPPDVMHATQEVIHPNAEHAYGSQISYLCEADFALVGSSMLECLHTGLWSSAPPTCEAITCGNPGTLNNGITLLAFTDDVKHSEIYGENKVSPRSAAISVCNDGYQLIDTTLFRSTPPVDPAAANMKQDAILAQLSNSSLDDHQKVKMTAALEAHFKSKQPPPSSNTRAAASLRSSTPPLRALDIRSCSATGAWLRSAPRCVSMPCSTPPMLTDGHAVEDFLSVRTFVFQDKVHYQCNEGFYFDSENHVRNGTATITCDWMPETSSVAWTALPGCLRRPCPKPSAAEHSSYSPNKPGNETFVFEESITYSCDDGYDLIGQEVLMCNSQGAWNHEPPLCPPVECPHIESLQNGQSQFTSNTYQSVVMFTCFPGYDLHGAAEVVCQANRQWSAPMPTCDPVPCGPPTSLTHGQVNTTSEVFMGEAIYTCDPGFEINGTDVVLCLETGDWFPEAPVCHRLRCPEPGVRDHVTFTVDSLPEVSDMTALSDDEYHRLLYVFETSITFACDSGYETFDALPLQADCTEFQTWSRDSPICVAKDCGPSLQPDRNGYREGSETTYDSHVTYFCMNGYYTISPEIVNYCTENGTWSIDTLPPCLPMDCGSPEDPLNGRHTGDLYTYPHSINYTCDQGYDRIGSDIAYCEYTGIWSNAPPLCKAVDCGLLPDVDNAILNITTTYFGSTAWYSCLPGYELIGLSDLHCTWNGLWDAVAPDCLPVDCGETGDLPNGLTIGRDHVFKSTVHFACNDGFNLHGNESAACMEDASWSNPPPDCIPRDCGTPHVVDDAMALWDGISTIFQSVVLYNCNPGFELTDSNISISECLANGVWSTAPECIWVTCLSPSAPTHGSIVEPFGPTFHYEDVVTYQCDVGYLPSGYMNATCNADTMWSNPPTICDPVDCGRLPSITNGVKTGSDTLLGAIVTYDCNTGHEAIGATTLECMHDGSWSNEAPHCPPVSCGEPPSLLFGMVIGGSTADSQVYESLIAFDCNEGYYLSGAVAASCGANRTWEFADASGPGGSTANNKPLCRKITCQTPVTVENAFFENKTYTYEDEVAYECNDGYDLVLISDGFKCSANKGDVEGFYSGFPPACEPVSCGAPSTIDNGFYVSKGTTFMTTATYSCHDGHYSTGVTEVVCLANRTWSGFPTCNPHDCGQPPLVNNAEVNTTSTLFKTVLQYQCDVGYALHGSGTTECLASAEWSSVDGWSCDPVPCGVAPDVANSTYIATGVVFGDTVTYRCDDGFKNSVSSSGLSTLHCLSDGRWEAATFTCQPVSCGPAASVTNGNVDVAVANWPASSLVSLFYPDVVEYSCKPGYQVQGMPIMSCTQNGTFSSPSPSCPPVLCGVPDALPNSALSYTGVTFGHQATHTCNIGHVLRNGSHERTSHTLRCTELETWGPVPPVDGCLPVHCPQPGYVEHATISTPKRAVNEYTDTVTYQCDSGYEATASSLTISCQADKSWSTPPTCNPVICGEPSCPGLSTCAKSGTTYGHNASSSCDPGHEFTTNITSFKITCEADRQWSVPEFDGVEVDSTTCRRHSCGSPSSIRNGRSTLNDGRVTYNATVTYTCDPGFELDPGTINTLTCSTDKTWGPDPLPICHPKDCGPIVCPVHASCQSDGTTFTSTFTATCNTGHELTYDVVSIKLTCLDSAKWSTDPSNLICSPVSCPEPAEISQGKIISGGESTAPVYQTTVKYECDLGYYMSGEAEVTCQADRSYSWPPPDCFPVSCGDPVNVEHAVADYSAITYQKTVRYTCSPGYDLVGDGVWKCSHSKQWIPLDAAAMLVADHTSRQKRAASVSGSNEASGSGDSEEVPPEDMISSRSFQPFAVGLSPLDPSPKCVPSPCGTAPIVNHGMPVNTTETLFFGDSVAYICENGFYLNGAASLNCLEDGSFGPSAVPTCERESCGVPPVVNYATYHAESPTGGPALFVFEDTVTYTCDSGYEYQSATNVNVITCADNRQWTPPQPDSCLPISCGNPPMSNHVIPSGTEFTFGNVVTYTCEPGYNVVGPTTLTCTSTKQWSPASAPTCSPVSCGRPEKIPHGSYTSEQSVDDQAFTFQRNVTYNCEPGYELDISTGQKSTLTCLASKAWDALAPRCNAVSCGPPFDIINGRYSGKVFTYGKEVNYACDVGHEMMGNPILTCSADKQWSSPPPTCTAVSCDRPPHVAHSQHTVSPSLTYGNNITYQCDAGYYRIGEQTLTCTASRVYDFSPPVCAPVSCGEPQQPAHTSIVSASGAVTFGHNVTYQCDVGYNERSGHPQRTITCTDQATWSDTFPLCDIVSCGSVTLPTHGSVDVVSETYLSTAYFSCDPGYELHSDGPTNNCDGARTCHVCQADGLWGYGDGTGAKSVRCEPLSCGEPSKVANGRFLNKHCSDPRNRTDFEGLVEKTFLVYNRTVACEESSMRCYNAATLADSFLFQSNVDYFCNSGYELHPPTNARLQCQDNYQWGPHPPPLCRRVACAAPATIAHGDYALTELAPSLLASRSNERKYIFEDVVQYTCEQGYRFATTNYSTAPHTGRLLCLSDSLWNKPAPGCEPVPCGLSPARQRGYLSNGESSRVFVFGEVAQYACDSGFEWIGSASDEQLTCSASGNWLPTKVPPCQPISCGAEPIVANGKVIEAAGGTSSRRIFGSHVTFRCLEGHYMVGKDTVECTATKKWSNNPPRCLPVRCAPLPTIQFAHPLPGRPVPAFDAMPLARSSLSSLSFSGSGELPTPSPALPAVEDEPAPPPDDYEPAPPADDNMPVASNDAQSLDAPSHMQMRRSLPEYVFGDIVMFACDSGYQLNSTSVDYLRCGASGQWLPPMPVCEPVPCDPLPEIPNARRVGNKFTFGEQVSFDCEQGFEADVRDVNIFTCNAGGKFQVWSDDPMVTAPAQELRMPTCARVACGEAPLASHSVIKDGSTPNSLYEDTLTYGCESGYNLRGHSVLTCQSNKTFDYERPTCEPVSCGQPPVILNTVRNVSSTVFQGTASYTCEFGYVHQTEEIMCQADGRWSPNNILCERVACGTPPHVENGLVDINGTWYGDHAWYSCLPGYLMSGNTERVCLPSGNWSDACPVCTPVDCGPPADPINGFHIAPGNYTYGEIVLFHCDEGYVSTGELFVTCIAVGMWSAPPPICTRISCGPTPLAIAADSLQPVTEHFFGDVITYECNLGHEFQTADRIICKSDGTFSAPPPVCSPVKCPPTPTIHKAKYIPGPRQHVVYGEQASYECVTGHVMEGNTNVLNCTASGRFSEPEFSCQPVQCPTLPFIAHGTLSQRTGVFEDVVEYSCDIGYLLQGSGQLVCEASGSWSENSTTCEPVPCGPAPVVQHGRVMDEQVIYTYGMQATYECKKGYELSHLNGGVERCGADGNFTDSKVQCIPVDCGNIVPNANANVTLESTTYTSRATIGCRDGYLLSTGQDVVQLVCQANRSWSTDPSTLTCLPVPCEALPPVANSNRTLVKAPALVILNGEASPGPAFDDRVIFHCWEGHRMTGSSELTCQADGRWSSDAPSCPPVVCGKAPQVDNARASDATFSFGMTVTYECAVGHEVAGDSMSRDCLADGTFTDNYIACQPKSCGDSPIVENAVASAASAVYGETVTYECDEGYQLDETNSITCGSSGRWKSSAPSCSPIQCPGLPDIPYSTVTVNGTNYQNEANFACDSGFRLNTREDAITLICLANRTWSRDLSSVRCDPVVCEMIRGILNGDMTVIPWLESLGAGAHVMHSGGSHTYGTKLSFTCNSGYFSEDPELIVCQANRLWSGPPPTCLPVQCNNPPSFPNARLTTGSHKFGSKALYECVNGHNLTSPGNFRICNANGNFSNHDVTCSPIPCVNLPEVKHGRAVSISGASPVFGDVADTICDEGYTLVGPGEFECLASGQWSKIEPTCEPNVCGFAPSIGNASPVAGTDIEYSYGDRVGYECNKGYTLSGKDDSLMCEANGSFSNTTITCTPVNCPSISAIAHSTVEGSSASFGNQVKITCNDGYEIAGRGTRETSLTCQHDGHWSEDSLRLSCVGIKCEAFKTFEHGIIDKRFATFRYESDQALVVYPSTAVYECESGYTLMGRSKRRCRADGSWTGESPFCQPIDCGSLPRFMHGTIGGDKTTIFGSEATYECDTGYKLSPANSSSRRCLETGWWSGVSPACILVTCEVPQKVQHGSASATHSVSYGTSVTYTCDTGFALNGSIVRTCQADGELDGKTASCNPVSCGAHPTVLDADIQPSGEIFYNQSVNVTCMKGILFGEKTRLCQINGNFSGELPSCEEDAFGNFMDPPFYDPFPGPVMEPVSCGPPDLQGTKAKLVEPLDPSMFFTSGTTLTLCCAHGYAASGDMVATCVDGNWTNIPQCMPKCRHRCLHKGTCSSGGTCSCVNGWAGSRCHRPVCILPCLNGGYCSAAFTCTCARGWIGDRCQTPICDRLCQNGGSCVAPNRCHCPYGYHGDDCSESSYFFFW